MQRHLIKCRLPLHFLSSSRSISHYGKNLQSAYSIPAEKVKHHQEEQEKEITKPTTWKSNSNDEKLTSEYIGRTGGEIFHETLAELGVKSVFGYPGGAILPVFDAIFQSKQMKFILTRHEQGAGHMAEGVAQATGQPGVVLVTSGPGATNTITAMQDALMDGRPMVVFCGQVATSVLGSDAFQEADVLGISRPCTKWNVQVRDVHDMARNIHEAFHIATTGRPGPVLVDLPKDIAASVCRKPISKEPRLLGQYSGKSSDVTVLNQEDKFNRVVNLLKIAKKPLIIAGHGAIDSCDEIKELALKYNIPVATTLHGLGVFDESHPLSLHMMGMHGSAYANKAVQEADLLMVVGARFDDRITGAISAFAPKASVAGLNGTGGIIHFDICPKQVSKIIPATVAIIGDAKKNLKKILPRLTEEVVTSPSWVQHIRTLKEKYPFRYRPSKSNEELKPQRVIEEFYTQTKNRNDILITTGVGQHQMWAAQYYRWKRPRTLVTSGGLGTMGFGLPTALGVKVARPDHVVVDIDGDASFSMTMQEMATASAYNIDVKVLLLNNNFQGMVRQWQDLFYDQRYCGTEMKNPDFCAVAKGMNWNAMRCTKEEDLATTMEKFLKTEGPVLAEFLVDKREHCYPMVGAGKPLSDIILGDFEDCRPTTSQ